MDAIDTLSDAIDVTRDFLTPVDARMWLKLAIIVFFISSVGFGGPSVPTGDPAPVDSQPADLESEIGYSMEEILVAIAVIVVLALAIGLLLAFIAAILEFVFLESLRSGDVHIRQYARANIGRGIHLFAFRVVVNGLLLALIGIPVGLLILRGTFDALTIVAILTLILVGLVLLFAVSIIMRFTADFVAPVMLLEERGILSAWGRWLETLRADPWEYVAYLLLVWFLQLIAATAAWIVIALGGFVILIPFMLLIAAVWIAGIGLTSGVGLIIVVPLLLIAIVLILLWMALVFVPVESYFTYYALLLLGDTDAELDLIPEQRATVRADGGETALDEGTE